MLPGIRFLLAAILLSMSILIFGLGAAALLRAAHEEVANVPTRRVMPEPVFAQAVEPPPTLALLRVEPALPGKSSEPTSAAAAPAQEPAPEAIPVPRVETEKLAALKLDDLAPPETGKPEVAAAPEAAAKQEAAPAEPAAPPTTAAEPGQPSTETKLAALEVSPSGPAETVSLPIEQIATPAMADPAPTTTRTAALGSPAKVENAAQAKTGEKPDRAELRKQRRAERAKELRRQAARRARLAAQQAAAAAATDPFSQPLQPAQPTSTTTRRR